MKPEPDTTPATTEQSPSVQADQKPTATQQMLRLSAELAERELGEALERWEDEGGACS
ncbi:MAG TPA: hypothetical protein VHW67_05735 [Solirubrobacteraceae bacterium]|jgi:hypothetical protein|nr:hypothetical protein [Solirubrobacteraceae bacterium]